MFSNGSLATQWRTAGALSIAAALISAPCLAREKAIPPEDSSAYAGQLAKLPDGRRLNFRCQGTGLPTVIFESGFAADSLAWSRVQPLVGARHRACAYDRAGYGFSDPGPLPRDGAAIARDLDQGLTAAGIGGPYILVGHSSGGLYARLFADRRPDDVVGLVLVDPSVEHQEARFAAQFGPGAGSLTALESRTRACLAAAQHGALPSAAPDLAACVPAANPKETSAVNAARRAEALRVSTWITELSELTNLWTLTSNELDAGRRSYGATPMVVLTADGKPSVTGGRESPGLAFWRRLHQEVAGRSSRGREALVAGSTHLMMFDRPLAIVDAIEEVAALAER